MLRRRVVGRAVVRTAVVGGTAYAVGHHAATKSAEQQQMDAQQNAQIADMQDQQAAQQQQAYQQPPPQAYQQPAPPPQAAAPAQSTGLTPDDITQLQQLGKLHESGVLTDAEFEAAKQKILGI
jgi:predicted flap endonuclease-1-like 5' DNA nuclease